MADVRLLSFFIRGKPVSRWYDFTVHRFVKAPRRRWVKVTVAYEGSAKGSYHIDCGAVRSALPDEVEDTKNELIRFVRSLVMDKLNWHNWTEIEMDLGLRVGIAIEDDGSKEEWCEVWRV